MRTTICREHYDQTISRLLCDMLTPEAAKTAFRSQYPKDAEFTRGELTYRGAACPVLPSRDYTAVEVDAMLLAYEAAGLLTHEAAASKAVGMTLAQYRAKFDAPLDVRREGGVDLVEHGCVVELRIPVDAELVRKHGNPDILSNG